MTTWRNKPRRSFGTVRKLPSGRYQARFVGPNGRHYTGPRTWKAKDDATGWLRNEERLIDLGVWTPPDERDAEPVARAVTFGEYATRWIEQRRLKASTRAQYEAYERLHVAGTTLAGRSLSDITQADIRDWWAAVRDTDAGKTDGATRNARVYALVRSILESAAEDGLIERNPARIKGASTTKRQRAIVVPTPAEVDQIAAAMPDRLSLLVLLASWCAMRRGELVGLRRMDVAPTGSVIHVRRGITYVKGDAVVDTTKSGKERTVAVPPHLHSAITDHLAAHVGKPRSSLLFPSIVDGKGGDIIDEWTLRYHWQTARAAAGRDDLRLHDLRHAGSMWAASAGATVPELQRRLGHASTAAALRYMHAADSSDVAIAARLSEMARTEPPTTL